MAASSRLRSFFRSRWPLKLLCCRCHESPFHSTARARRSTDTPVAPGVKYRRKIRMDFYYDTVSPYSWLAFEIIQRYQPIWNLDIDLKPVFAGGITAQAGNKYLENMSSSPSKAKYLFQDVERAGKYYKVPLRVPESPFYLLAVAGSLRQQRFLTTVKKYYPDYLESVSREFWFRCWAEDKDATKESSLIVVAGRAGLDSEEIAHCIEAMAAAETKEALKQCTREAVEEGGFGVPYIVVHLGKNAVETFFGSDRFEIMANSLGVKWLGPLPDPERYQPLELPPEPTQKEVFDQLENMGAIAFKIPDDADDVLQKPE